MHFAIPLLSYMTSEVQICCGFHSGSQVLHVPILSSCCWWCSQCLSNSSEQFQGAAVPRPLLGLLSCACVTETQKHAVLLVTQVMDSSAPAAKHVLNKPVSYLPFLLFPTMDFWHESCLKLMFSPFSRLSSFLITLSNFLQGFFQNSPMALQVTAFTHLSESKAKLLLSSFCIKSEQAIGRS